MWRYPLALSTLADSPLLPFLSLLYLLETLLAVTRSVHPGPRLLETDLLISIPPHLLPIQKSRPPGFPRVKCAPY